MIYNPRSKVIHKDPPHEVCNTDQLKKKEHVDVIPNDARLCKHCFA